MNFNNKFVEMWRKDGYIDYLSPPKEKAEEARSILGRLVSRNSTDLLKASNTNNNNNISGFNHNNNTNNNTNNSNSNKKHKKKKHKKKTPMKEKKSEGLLKGEEKEIAEKKLLELLTRRPSLALMLEKNINTNSSTE